MFYICSVAEWQDQGGRSVAATISPQKMNLKQAVSRWQSPSPVKK
jgi:hypothetical protein